MARPHFKFSHACDANTEMKMCSIALRISLAQMSVFMEISVIF